MTGVGDGLDGPVGFRARDAPTPKLVIVGAVWAFLGVVALITALLMARGSIAVFGVLCVLAGGGLYLGQRAREQFEHDEAVFRADPHAAVSDEEEVPDDAPEPAADGTDENATRVMTSERGGSRDDDIVDAEYTEHFDYGTSPADQDDGTGYDEEEEEYQRWRGDHAAREAQAHADERDEDRDEAGTDEAGTGASDGSDAASSSGSSSETPAAPTASSSPPPPTGPSGSGSGSAFRGRSASRPADDDDTGARP